MAYTTLLIMAVALAMDAFTVAIAAGVQLQGVTAVQTLRMAGTFGFFQFVMPIAGGIFGAGIQSHIEAYDHWIAFALLAFIGVRMLKEAWDARGQTSHAQHASRPSDPTRGTRLLVLGVATSIDALAVGLSMAILGQDVFFPALVIGIVCFAFTACGIQIGRIMRSFAGNWGNCANIFGGLVLIAIGISILQEHGVFA
jgi:putative Mn2+ efflux pump MntP